MMTDLKCDIAILGFGFSAMITAIAFASRGKSVVMIKPSKPSGSDNRTTALSNYSWNYLKNILRDSVIASERSERGNPALRTDKMDCRVGSKEPPRNDAERLFDDLGAKIADIYVLDDKACHRMLHFSAKTVEEEAMGYIVVNDEFKELLRCAVEAQFLITIMDQGDYTKIENKDDGCIIHFETNHVSSQLLVICSGANSHAYKSYFRPHTLKYYNQKALTFNTQHENPHENTAIEHFMPTGPFAILPLKDQYKSAVVWSLTNELADIYASMPQAEFEYHIQKNFGDFLGKVKVDSNIDVFPLKAYITEQYFYKRAVLVADSAHIIHPLAGQGLNQGIKDIETLVNLTCKIGICEEMLEKYQDLRKHDNISMFLVTDNLDRIFSNDYPILSGMRKLGLHAIESSAFLKKQFIRYACGKR
jgi:2-octaprenyl-6-methoxyphenol hydroxylase